MNIHIAPHWMGNDNGTGGGIRRVWEAMVKYLPDHGFTIVDTPDAADIINCHATVLITRPGVPMVASCHGLHWSDHPWPRSSHIVNREVRETLIQGDGWTAPSEWVRRAMVRGMAIDPLVIYHGCDIPAEVKPNEGYILWNKSRADAVCDPSIVLRLAERLPHREFVTTFLQGQAPSNVHVTGGMPPSDMLDHVARAGAYLATTQETFGIGTIEAMAAGVPIVGYDHAGQREIVRNGETGILAPLGNIDALAEAIELAFVHRERLGEAARQDAIQRWQWPDKVAQYAQYFRKVYATFHEPRPRVSLIVAYRNLGQFIPDTISSAIQQDMQDWEMVIVDDASDDENAAIVREQAARDERITLLRSDENIRPSRARNMAASKAKGKYIMPLDADDMLAPRALSLLAGELDRDRSIALAYGALELMSEDGQNRRRGPWPPETFDWHKQLAKENQMPYCPMMRREVLERTGGYRAREISVEDAGLWCRATSVGFRAKKVTQASTIWYRLREASWGKGPSQLQDWTAWLSWHHGQAIPPWGAQGEPNDGTFWPVPAHTNPHIAIVIPVGPGHEHLLTDALDSVYYSQRYPWWECIVVNDTGKPWLPAHHWGSPVQGAAWARVIDSGGRVGIAAARNLGWKATRCPLVLFLDADDYLTPTMLEEGIRLQRNSGGIVYPDALVVKSDGGTERVDFPEFALNAVLAKMEHTNTTIIPKAALEDVGGYDPKLKGWEDWDLYIALRAAGWCSTHLRSIGLVYRHGTGQRREDSLSKQDAILKQIRKKWATLFSGEVDLMACGCSKTATLPAPMVSASMQAAGGQALQVNGQAFTLVEFTSSEMATQNYRGRFTGRAYRFAASDDRRVQPVDNRDVETFRNRPEFRILEQ